MNDAIQVYDGDGVSDVVPRDLWINQRSDDIVHSEMYDGYTLVQFLFPSGDNPLLEIPSWWGGILFGHIGSARVDEKDPTTKVERYSLTDARISLIHRRQTSRRPPGVIFRTRLYEHFRVDFLAYPTTVNLISPTDMVLGNEDDP